MDENNQGSQGGTAPRDDQSAIHNQQQFADAKASADGMMSSSYGDGLGQFISPDMPDAAQETPDAGVTAADAQSEVVVSQDPSIDTSSSPSDGFGEFAEFASPSSPQVQDYDIADPNVSDQSSEIQQDSSIDFVMPQADAAPTPSASPVDSPAASPASSGVAPSGPVGSVSTPSLGAPSLAPVSAPEPLLERGLPSPAGLWPPGSGEEKSDKEKRREQREFNRQKDLQERKAQATKANAPADGEAGRPPSVLDGSQDGSQPRMDFGDRGQDLSGTSNATENAHSDALNAATDSIGFAGEQLIAVIRLMASMLLRIGNDLAEVRDRLESEDEPDTW